jgi:hypothetical protein
LAVKDFTNSIIFHILFLFIKSRAPDYTIIGAGDRAGSAKLADIAAFKKTII